MRVLIYLKDKYEGFIGVPLERLERETLEERNKVPKEAIKTSFQKRFISFEWVAKQVEKLNS